MKKELIRAFNGEKNYRFYQIKKENIEEALKDIPSLIIINEDTIDNDIIELCRKIKDNDDNAITPTIVISSNTSREHRVRILKESVTYYIKKPIDFEYLYYTIKNITNLLYVNRKVSPLTNLPGNVQIQAEITKQDFLFLKMIIKLILHQIHILGTMDHIKSHYLSISFLLLIYILIQLAIQQ